ncbi:MAG: hypothetical protein K2I90_11355 [Odoribacter sp.]|nr:hypothetical protein [Odoribacter sp.]
MKITTIISLLMLAGCLFSCRQEDDLEPSEMSSSFAPVPGATDQTSKLREEFYKATGCYLLFNDTLKHEYKGLDAYGKPYYETELVDLNWNMTSVGKARLRFEYLELKQQEKASEFLSDYLIPYVKDILPYSVLAVRKINQYTHEEDVWEYSSSPLTISNINCLALNLSELWEGKKDEETLAQDLCCEMILANWGGDATYYYSGGKAEAFFKVMRRYQYNKSWYDIPYGLGETGMEELKELGFLINTDARYTPSEKEDVISYIKACLRMTAEEFEDLYGDYDVIMRKYNILKPLVDETGIKF